MVHAAVGYARQCDRLSAHAVTTSIGPGATNLVTGAALATVNRLPVLLLPGDTFATRPADPVLQQLEVPVRGRCVRQRRAAPGLPLLRPRHPPRGADPGRPPGDAGARRPRRDRRRHPRPAAGRPGRGVRLARGVLRRPGLARPPARPGRRRPSPTPSRAVRAARRPLLVAGGGVHHSEAEDALRAFADTTGIPVASTQAGKGSLRHDHPADVGGIGHTGTATADAPRPRGRPGHRRRHPLHRLHHRLRAPSSPRPACASSTSTSPPSTPTSSAPLSLVADARAGLEALTARAGRPPRRRGVRGGLRARRRPSGSAASTPPTPPSDETARPSQTQVLGALDAVVDDTDVDHQRRRFPPR